MISKFHCVAEPDPITIPDSWPDRFYAFAAEQGIPLKVTDILARALGRNPHWLLDHWVATQLRQRKVSLEDAWTDYPELLRFAERLQPLFAEILWSFKPVFLPGDHFALLSRVFSGQFREVEMVIAIEQEFDSNLPDQLFPMRLTMLELLQELERQDSQSA